MMCRICGNTTELAGTVFGRHAQRAFTLRSCSTCGYACVVDPVDPATVYTDDYYAGHGADHVANYAQEAISPERTIRWYELRGLTRTVEHLTGTSQGLRWLDYGAGTGGLVAYANQHRHRAVGYEPHRPDSINLNDHRGACDVVTAIEVIEHIEDPLPALREMRSLLKPGGLLFLTTGNAAPYRDRLPGWRYVIPEIHVSYFEPRTLALAYRKVGLEPADVGMVPGMRDVLKYKVLKNLRVKRRSVLTDLLPSGPVAWAGDRLAHVTDQPAGWAV